MSKIKETNRRLHRDSSNLKSRRWSYSSGVFLRGFLRSIKDFKSNCSYHNHHQSCFSCKRLRAEVRIHIISNLKPYWYESRNWIVWCRKCPLNPWFLQPAGLQELHDPVLRQSHLRWAKATCASSVGKKTVGIQIWWNFQSLHILWNFLETSLSTSVAAVKHCIIVK